MRALVKTRDGVTAVVCGAHSLAPTLLRAKDTAGIRIPEDCSFITYGDSPWAAAFRPPLAVVRRDLYAKAMAITGHVIARLDGDEHAASVRTDPTAHSVEYVARESVGQAQPRRG
jgi:DNA-binding LacI/PurR family transcriptional regulator